jgi:phospholipid-binding lipoprotein MlaA
MEPAMPVKSVQRFIIILMLVAIGCLHSGLALAQEHQQQANGEDTVVAQKDLDPFAEDEFDLQVSDPIEPVNRAIFWFNDKIYFYLLKPVARGYRIVPKPARNSVANFFSNLTTPVRFANSLLQLKARKAGTELARFVVNSTIGVLGLFDPGKDWLGLKKTDEDFGQTLGFYGAGEGFYLVLPVLGPSSLRDGIGRVGDYFADPISSPYYFILNDWEKYALEGLNTVNALSLDKDTYEGIKRDALDPYLFLRNSYSQYRQSKIKN